MEPTHNVMHASVRECVCSCDACNGSRARTTASQHGEASPGLHGVKSDPRFPRMPTALMRACAVEKSGAEATCARKAVWAPAAPCGPATGARTEGMWGMDGTGGMEGKGDDSWARRRASGAGEAVGT
jgi:hypothetical protein